MKIFTIIFLLLFHYMNLCIVAQLTVKDQDATPHTLFQVIDNGISGVLLMPPLVTLSGDADQKLYNIGGTLYWNGNQVGTSFTAAGWEQSGTSITTATGIDKVGIAITHGTTPNVKLSLGTDISLKKLALFDGIDDFYGFGVDLGRITFYTNNTEKMTIKDNGNVGIGTTNPSKKLEVDEGNILVKGINSFQTTGDAGTLFLGSVHHYIKGEYGFGVKIGTYIVGDAISIREGSGAVGIGTTNPTAKLDVNGNVKVGSNGIRISEIYELTGTTGTGISTLVTLPSGYDGSNTRVLSIEFESATSGGIWVGGVKNEPGGLEYILAANYVSINHPNTIKYQNAKFRMMLMKVE